MARIYGRPDAAGSMSGGADLAAVAAFIHREARLLDERRFGEWRALFASDGVYWVPARAEQTDPLHEVSLFYDDPVMMAARVRRLGHPRMFAELPPSRAVRSVSNIEVLPAAGEGTSIVGSSRLLSRAKS